MSGTRGAKWCVLCGRPGHHSHACPWQEKLPRPKSPPAQQSPEQVKKVTS